MEGNDLFVVTLLVVTLKIKITEKIHAKSKGLEGNDLFVVTLLVVTLKVETLKRSTLKVKVWRGTTYQK